MPKVKPVKFEVGDVVYLKSEDKYAKDRFRMTVKSVTGEYPDIQEVECIRLSKGGILQTHKFAPILLDKH